MDSMADQFGEIGVRVEQNERRKEAVEAEKARLERDNEDLKQRLDAKRWALSTFNHVLIYGCFWVNGLRTN